MNRSTWWGVSPDLLTRFAVERVQRGGIAKNGERYLDHGRPVPGYISAALDNATQAGLVTLTEADPAGLRQVVFTDTGRARYLHPSGPIR